MTPQDGEQASYVLRRRDGKLSSVKLSSGRTFPVWNISWFRDLGESFDLIQANISPTVDQQGRVTDIDPIADTAFLTSDIESIEDEWGNTLFRAAPSPYHR